ncbi:MAG TPA: hypothetical protein PLE45_00335 [Spirochaetota bacterium]|nr:hypothetical protein [Spirochaetota bacterium]HOL56507.1 hypothetical protein [Spirochaetota bacterium]HPP03951.1 hypothetical protein [Spirochaetota bacterium]
MKKLMIFLFLTLILNVYSNDDKELKIKREQKLKNYYYLVKSGTRETRLNVLNNILKEYDELKYSEKDDKLLEIIEFLLNEGTVSIDTSSNRVINNFPDVRRLCVTLLGKLGGESGRYFIINILHYDNDYTVKREVCDIIANGLIEDNNKNDLLNTLIKIYNFDSKGQPESFISSYIKALTTTAKGKSFYYSDVIKILADINISKIYSEKIRKEALESIDYLGKNN